MTCGNASILVAAYFPWNGAVLMLHVTPAEWIMAAFVASMALLVLLADFLPSPERRDTDEPTDTDDVRQRDESEPSEMAAAA